MINKNSIASAFKTAKRTVVKESPYILMFMGITGYATACYLAVKETPKALEAVDEEITRLNEEKRGERAIDVRSINVDWDTGVILDECVVENPIEKLDPVDTVKIVWKFYIPAAVMFAVSTMCIVGSSSINMRRNAALATAYTLSEAALKEYKDKVVETVGVEKAEEIKQSILADKAKKIVKDDVLLETGSDDFWCLDTLSGRKFISNKNKIASAVNEVNRIMRNGLYIQLNDFYEELGLERTKTGEMLGWHIDDGYLDIDYKPVLMDNGIMCLVLEYDVAPMYNYDRMY